MAPKTFVKLLIFYKSNASGLNEHRRVFWYAHSALICHIVRADEPYSQG